MFLLWPAILRQPKMQPGRQTGPLRKMHAMKFRNVTLLLAAGALLAGCQAFQEGSYEVQKQFGLYPVDPPRQEHPMPPPGTVSQAEWTAQRTTTLRATNQSYTAPVGYKEPEQAAPQQAEQTKAEQAKPAGAQPVATAATPASPRNGARPAAATPTTSPAAAPVPAAANPAAMTPAAPVASSLPAGYTPSPSVVDRPADASEQQKLAAAIGAQPTPPEAAKMPTPPEMVGSMKTSASPVPGWKAHLASHRSESAAINEWQELLKGNAAFYGQFDPLVEWTDTQRGAFARLVLVGFADRKAADDACAKIRSSTRYCASVQ